jgi:hypothetical protein
MNLPEGKGAHFIALLKSIQVRTHTKQSMEMSSTEEDYEHNRMAIKSAKNLYPEHESVPCWLCLSHFSHFSAFFLVFLLCFSFLSIFLCFAGVVGGS